MSRFSTCTCHRANWSGKDKEGRGVSHIRGFQEGSSCQAPVRQAFLLLLLHLLLLPPQVCNSAVSQAGNEALSFWRNPKLASCTTKSKDLHLVFFVFFSFFFSFSPTRPFKLCHSFKYSIKTEQKTFTHMFSDTDLHKFWIHIQG